jgi:hypothetical protein
MGDLPEPIANSNPGERPQAAVLPVPILPEPPIPDGVSEDVRYLAEVHKWSLGTVRAEVLALRNDQAINFGVLHRNDRRLEVKIDAHGSAWGWLTGTAKAFSDPQFVQRIAAQAIGFLSGVGILYGAIQATGCPANPGAVHIAQPVATVPASPESP